MGADLGPGSNVLNTVDYFISHEGLMLEYEQVLTRDTLNGPYDLSAHTVWLGDRTRQVDGAHVEFFRHIRNPIGIKVGPSMVPDELVRVLDAVNPHCEKGRVTLISRYGAAKVRYTKFGTLTSDRCFAAPAHCRSAGIAPQRHCRVVLRPYAWQHNSINF